MEGLFCLKGNIDIIYISYIHLNMTDEQFKQLIPKELISLQEEYNVFKNKMK